MPLVLSVLCQSECAYLHQTGKNVVSTQMGEHSCKLTELSFKQKQGEWERNTRVKGVTVTYCFYYMSGNWKISFYDL